MGFVGGVGNVAIATALPSSSFLYCIVNMKYFMDFLYLIFYACLRLRFLDVETNPGPKHPVPAVCRILCSNVRGLAGNLSDLTVHGFVSVWYTVVLWDFGLKYESRVGVGGSRIRSPCLVVMRQDASRPRDGCICTTWLRSTSPTQKFQCGCCEMLVLGVYGVRQNLYVFSFDCNPDLDDRILDYHIGHFEQAEDILASQPTTFYHKYKIYMGTPC